MDPERAIDRGEHTQLREHNVKLRKIRNEAYRLKKRLSEQQQKAEQLKAEIGRLEMWLGNIEQLPEEAHTLLGLSTRRLQTTPPLLLKIRLRGMLEEAKARLESTQREQRATQELLESLYVCYMCGGRGVKPSKTKYVREDGVITPITSTQICELCQGTGRIKIKVDCPA